MRGINFEGNFKEILGTYKIGCRIQENYDLFGKTGNVKKKSYWTHD